MLVNYSKKYNIGPRTGTGSSTATPPHAQKVSHACPLFPAVVAAVVVALLPNRCAAATYTMIGGAVPSGTYTQDTVLIDGGAVLSGGAYIFDISAMLIGTPLNVTIARSTVQGPAYMELRCPMGPTAHSPLAATIGPGNAFNASGVQVTGRPPAGSTIAIVGNTYAFPAANPLGGSFGSMAVLLMRLTLAAGAVLVMADNTADCTPHPHTSYCAMIASDFAITVTGPATALRIRRNHFTNERLFDTTTHCNVWAIALSLQHAYTLPDTFKTTVSDGAELLIEDNYLRIVKNGTFPTSGSGCTYIFPVIFRDVAVLNQSRLVVRGNDMRVEATRGVDKTVGIVSIWSGSTIQSGSLLDISSNNITGNLTTAVGLTLVNSAFAAPMNVSGKSTFKVTGNRVMVNAAFGNITGGGLGLVLTAMGQSAVHVRQNHFSLTRPALGGPLAANASGIVDVASSTRLQEGSLLSIQENTLTFGGTGTAPFIAFESGAVVDGGSRVEVLGNTVAAPVAPTPRQPILGGFSCAGWPTCIFAACRNIWYGDLLARRPEHTVPAVLSTPATVRCGTGSSSVSDTQTQSDETASLSAPSKAVTATKTLHVTTTRTIAATPTRTVPVTSTPSVSGSVARTASAAPLHTLSTPRTHSRDPSASPSPAATASHAPTPTAVMAPTTTTATTATATTTTTTTEVTSTSTTTTTSTTTPDPTTTTSTPTAAPIATTTASPTTTEAATPSSITSTSAPAPTTTAAPSPSSACSSDDMTVVATAQRQADGRFRATAPLPDGLLLAGASFLVPAAPLGTVSCTTGGSGGTTLVCEGAAPGDDDATKQATFAVPSSALVPACTSTTIHVGIVLPTAASAGTASAVVAVVLVATVGGSALVAPADPTAMEALAAIVALIGPCGGPVGADAARYTKYLLSPAISAGPVVVTAVHVGIGLAAVAVHGLAVAVSSRRATGQWWAAGRAAALGFPAGPIAAAVLLYPGTAWAAAALVRERAATGALTAAAAGALVAAVAALVAVPCACAAVVVRGFAAIGYAPISPETAKAQSLLSRLLVPQGRWIDQSGAKERDLGAIAAAAVRGPVNARGRLLGPLRCAWFVAVCAAIGAPATAAGSPHCAAQLHAAAAVAGLLLVFTVAARPHAARATTLLGLVAQALLVGLLEAQAAGHRDAPSAIAAAVTTVTLLRGLHTLALAVRGARHRPADSDDAASNLTGDDVAMRLVEPNA